jgi:hypothetical protein
MERERPAGKQCTEYRDIGKGCPSCGLTRRALIKVMKQQFRRQRSVTEKGKERNGAHAAKLHTYSFEHRICIWRRLFLIIYALHSSFL